MPKYLHGQSLKRILNDPDLPGDVAVSYTRASTIRTDRFRLIAHKSGQVELYDHHSKLAETENMAAAFPEVTKQLHEILQSRIALKSQ